MLTSDLEMTAEGLMITPPVAAAPQTTANIAQTDTTLSPFLAELGRPEVQAGIYTFDQMQAKLNALQGAWTGEIQYTKNRRNTRKLDIDVRKLRESGKIPMDETFIPIRLIDMNVTRQTVTFVNYFTQSHRAAIFECNTQPATDVTQLEMEFTRCYRFDGWQVPYYQVVDGTKTHGWDSVMLCFEPSKPGAFYFYHIQHDRLLFPKGISNIQSCETLTVLIPMTASAIYDMIRTSGWNEQAVKEMLAGWVEDYEKAGVGGTAQQVEPMYDVGQCFYKEPKTGYIYVAWYDPGKKAQNWLKAPVPLYLGVDKSVEKMVDQPILDPATGMPMLDDTGRITMTQVPSTTIVPEFETTYPIFLLPNRITEEHAIDDQVGRAFLDEPKQEALTTMWSSMVNGMQRASNIYASPANSNVQNMTGAPKLLDTEITPGAVYDQKMDFWTPPYPDPAIFQAMQGLEQQNAAETNQIAWGVNNRKDSRKTAKEVGSAEQQNSQINSAELLVFALFEAQCVAAAWRIVRSRALYNGLVFLNNVSPEQKAELLAKDYTVKSPGIIDVVRRDEKIQKISAMLPQMQGSMLGNVMLADLLGLMFPEKGTYYQDVLAQQNQQPQAMAAMAQVIGGLLQQFGEAIPPQELQRITGIMQAAQQTVVTPPAPK